MVKNWKTSTAGLGSIFAAVGGLIHDVSIGDYSRVVIYIPIILGGIGNIFSKDKDVTGAGINARKVDY